MGLSRHDRLIVVLWNMALNAVILVDRTMLAIMRALLVVLIRVVWDGKGDLGC